MPANSRALEHEVQQQDAMTAQARAGQIAQQIPPASEPLKAQNLDMLGQVLQQAVPALSGGQVPELPMPEFQDADQAPPELGTALITVAAFLGEAAKQNPKLQPYAFDATEALSSNDGLMSAAHSIASLLEDDAAMQSIAGGQPAQERETPAEDAGAADQLSGEG